MALAFICAVSLLPLVAVASGESEADDFARLLPEDPVSLLQHSLEIEPLLVKGQQPRAASSATEVSGSSAPSVPAIAQNPAQNQATLPAAADSAAKELSESPEVAILAEGGSTGKSAAKVAPLRQDVQLITEVSAEGEPITEVSAEGEAAAFRALSGEPTSLAVQTDSSAEAPPHAPDLVSLEVPPQAELQAEARTPDLALPSGTGLPPSVVAALLAEQATPLKVAPRQEVNRGFWSSYGTNLIQAWDASHGNTKRARAPMKSKKSLAGKVWSFTLESMNKVFEADLLGVVSAAPPMR